MSDSLPVEQKNLKTSGAMKTMGEVLDTRILSDEENILEQARTQWQFGDWDSLCNLGRETIQHHPERAKLALLAASGMLQTGCVVAARQFITLAQDWGISKKLLVHVLISGVHNTLGRLYLAKGEDGRAINHFEDAINLVLPSVDRRLLGESRAVRQAAQIGLLSQAVRLMGRQLKETKKSGDIALSRITILETEIELLNHELSLAIQRQQLFVPKSKQEVELHFGSNEWKTQLKKKSVSQLGQDLWVLEKTKFKHGGFFVEFGATDGVLLSNTWLLEKEFSWRGICCEPNPEFYKKLLINRNCAVSNQYIGKHTGADVEFVLAGVYGSGRHFIDADHHENKRKAYFENGKSLLLKSISLNDFLIQHNAPQYIDYISIDTEGNEYDLLQEFPFRKWNIYLFTIEHNYSRHRREIAQLMAAHGYVRVEREWDDWYEKSTRDVVKKNFTSDFVE